MLYPMKGYSHSVIMRNQTYHLLLQKMYMVREVVNEAIGSACGGYVDITPNQFTGNRRVRVSYR
jgi:hypothetical protein